MIVGFGGYRIARCTRTLRDVWFSNTCFVFCSGPSGACPPSLGQVRLVWLPWRLMSGIRWSPCPSMTLALARTSARAVFSQVPLIGSGPLLTRLLRPGRNVEGSLP